MKLLNDLDEEQSYLSPSPEPPDPSFPLLFLRHDLIFDRSSPHALPATATPVRNP